MGPKPSSNPSQDDRYPHPVPWVTFSELAEIWGQLTKRPRDRQIDVIIIFSPTAILSAFRQIAKLKFLLSAVHIQLLKLSKPDSSPPRPLDLPGLHAPTGASLPLPYGEVAILDRHLG